MQVEVYLQAFQICCVASLGCVGWVGSVLGSVTKSISHGTVEA